MAKFLKQYCVHIPQRFLVCGMLFAACILCVMDRQAYFQTIYKMVYIPTPSKLSNSECPVMQHRGNSKVMFPDFIKIRFFWEREQLRAVTHALYLGLIISNIPAGFVADHYGGRWVITVGVLMGSLTTLMYPTIALQGPVQLVLARLIQGLGQGLVFSSLNSIMAQWTPKSERTRGIAIITSGLFAGWGIGYGLPHISHRFMDVWQMPLYLTGAVGLLWVLVWLLFCSSKPSQSVYITDAELQYILSDREGIEDQIPLQKFRVPWKAVLTSPPVWSLLLLNWAFSWVQYTMMNQLKFYSANVLRISDDLSQMAAMFAEVLTTCPSTIFWGFVSDYLVNNNYMSRTDNRKLFGVACNMLMAPCLLAIPLAGCSGLTVFCLYVGLDFFRGLHYSATDANPLDLSPRYAGLLSALVDTTGNLAAVFAWESVYNMLQRPSDMSNWWILFVWMFALLVILSLPYIWFGSGEVQPWNFPARRSMPPSRSQSATSIPLSRT